MILFAQQFTWNAIGCLGCHRWQANLLMLPETVLLVDAIYHSVALRFIEIEPPPGQIFRSAVGIVIFL